MDKDEIIKDEAELIGNLLNFSAWLTKHTSDPVTFMFSQEDYASILFNRLNLKRKWIKEEPAKQLEKRHYSEMNRRYEGDK